MRSNLSRVISAAVLSLAALSGPYARAGFVLGDAANFVVLYEGAGKQLLGTTNVTINGNIGIGAPSGSTTAGWLAIGPGAINGSVLFAGAVKDSVKNTTITGTVTGNNVSVQTDLNSLNNLSASLGKEAGTALAVNLTHAGQGLTINASSGTLDANGNRVFTVSSFNFKNGTTLTINGNGSGNSVVINFSKNAQFGGTIVLTGGLTANQVLFNFTGNDSLQANGGTLAGTFLDPNGTIAVANTTISGHVFGGDAGSMQITSGDKLYAPVPPSVTPEPSTITMLVSGLAVLGLIGVCRFRRS
jgi:choice-of-anchor A domain-containing protein